MKVCAAYSFCTGTCTKDLLDEHLDVAKFAATFLADFPSLYYSATALMFWAVCTLAS
jgi:hypothetical protein